MMWSAAMHDFSERNDNEKESRTPRRRVSQARKEDDQRALGVRLLQEFGIVIVIPLAAALVFNLLLRLAWQ